MSEIKIGDYILKMAEKPEKVRKKKGRPVGLPKTPGSGRTKGTVNKATLLEKGLSPELCKEEDHLNISREEKIRTVMDALWKQAVFKDSTQAARIWHDMDNQYYGHDLDELRALDQLDSFDGMDAFSSIVIRCVIMNKLAPGAANMLMALLKDKKIFKEAALEPILAELIKMSEDKKKILTFNHSSH